MDNVFLVLYNSEAKISGAQPLPCCAVDVRVCAVVGGQWTYGIAFPPNRKQGSAVKHHLVFIASNN